MQKSVLAALLLYSMPLLAAEPPKAPREKSAFEKELIKRNIRISEQIDSVAEQLDVLLSGKKVTKEPNRTTIRVENSAYWTEGGELDTSIHFDVNLRLPNLEKRWKLKFSSYDQTEEERSITQRQFRQDSREENYGASLVLFEKLGDISTSFQPRIELNDPLEVSYFLEFESEAKMKNYVIDPEIQLYAQPDKGTGIFGSIKLVFELTSKAALSFIHENEYEDGDNLFTVNNGISYGYSLSEVSGVSLSLASSSNNRPAFHLEQYGASMTYNHTLYKRVLVYSVSPVINFPKNRGFKGTTGLRLSVDLIF